jgi:hypothetical protein
MQFERGGQDNFQSDAASDVDSMNENTIAASLFYLGLDDDNESVASSQGPSLLRVILRR